MIKKYVMLSLLIPSISNAAFVGWENPEVCQNIVGCCQPCVTIPKKKLPIKKVRTIKSDKYKKWITPDCYKELENCINHSKKNCKENFEECKGETCPSVDDDYLKSLLDIKPSAGPVEQEIVENEPTEEKEKIEYETTGYGYSDYSYKPMEDIKGGNYSYNYSPMESITSRNNWTGSSVSFGSISFGGVTNNIIMNNIDGDQNNLYQKQEKYVIIIENKCCKVEEPPSEVPIPGAIFLLASGASLIIYKRRKCL
jgi:hypothetical protein